MTRSFSQMHDDYLDPDKYFAEEEPRIYNCKHCGSFLRHQEDSVISKEKDETYEEVDGSTFTEHHYWTELTRACPKCGKPNLETVY